MGLDESAAPKSVSDRTASKAEGLSVDFVKGLRDINRYRFLDLMLTPRQGDSNGIELTPTRAAILALLWELDDLQKGPADSRIAISRMGELLDLDRNATSAQIGPLSEAGFCEELRKANGQDRRMRYYVLTDTGRQILNRFLDQSYRLEDSVYRGVTMERVREVLDKVTQKVKRRIDGFLSQSS